MKKLIIIQILLFVSCIGYAQTPHSEVVLKKGIYKTKQEFIENNPSIELKYDIVNANYNYGTLGIGGSINCKKLIINRKKCKEIGNIFGFGDGEQFYRNISLKFNPKSKFSILEKYGKHYIYENIIITYVNHGGDGGSSKFKDIVISVLEDKTFSRFNFSKSNIRKLLKTEVSLFEEYKAELLKNEKLKVFLIRYFELNPEKNWTYAKKMFE